MSYLAALAIIFAGFTVAGAGWHFGFSLIQTGVNCINLWLTKRAAAKRAKEEEDARVEKVMNALAKEPVHSIAIDRKVN